MALIFSFIEAGVWGLEWPCCNYLKALLPSGSHLSLSLVDPVSHRALLHLTTETGMGLKQGQSNFCSVINNRSERENNPLCWLSSVCLSRHILAMWSPDQCPGSLPYLSASHPTEPAGGTASRSVRGRVEAKLHGLTAALYKMPQPLSERLHTQPSLQFPVTAYPPFRCRDKKKSSWWIITPRSTLALAGFLKSYTHHNKSPLLSYPRVIWFWVCYLFPARTLVDTFSFP